VIDYHVHERHSRDAITATVAEYVKVAEARGINEIAFTTHLITTGPDVDVSIPVEELSEYVDEIEDAKETTNVRLLIGLEVDYFPEEERHLEHILSEYQFDFILGSTHYINGIDIGSRSLAEQFFAGRSISEGADEYFRVWRQAIESGLFDVMAHPDYWRKYIHLFRERAHWSDYGSVVFDALELLAKDGVGIEVNTSGIRHGIGSFFPLQEFLIAAHDVGVKAVTVGSDSHTAGTLGFKLEEAARQLREAGFTTMSTFRGRKNTKVSIDNFLMSGLR